MAVMTHCFQFVDFDGKPLESTGKKPTPRPHENVDDLKELVSSVMDAWIEEDKVPTPLTFAKQLNKYLVSCGHMSEDDDILYDFEQHYKLKFNIKEVPYYFETWRTWNGALNWVIEDNTA